jgi:hypothetical protein
MRSTTARSERPIRASSAGASGVSVPKVYRAPVAHPPRRLLIPLGRNAHGEPGCAWNKGRPPHGTGGCGGTTLVLPMCPCRAFLNAAERSHGNTSTIWLEQAVPQRWAALTSVRTVSWASLTATGPWHFPNVQRTRRGSRRAVADVLLVVAPRDPRRLS